MNATRTETALGNYGWGLVANSNSVCSEGQRKTSLKSFWGDFLCNERTEGGVDGVCAVAINHLLSTWTSPQTKRDQVSELSAGTCKSEDLLLIFKTIFLIF